MFINGPTCSLCSRLLDISKKGNFASHASCESFIKTLKREEIYANKYNNLEDLRTNIEVFIEQYYNRQRLYSALGYRSPEEFEAMLPSVGGWP